MFPAAIRVSCAHAAVFVQWGVFPAAEVAPATLWSTLGVTGDPRPPARHQERTGGFRAVGSWLEGQLLPVSRGRVPPVPGGSGLFSPFSSASPRRWPVPQSPRGHQPPVEPHTVSSGTTHRPGVPAVSSQSGKAAAVRKERGQEAASGRGGGGQALGSPLPARRRHLRPRSRPRALWAQVLRPPRTQPVAGTGAHPELGASQKSQPVHSRRPVGHAGCPRANGGVRLGIAWFRHNEL